jgi:lipopolysaccharide transport system permease protein
MRDNFKELWEYRELLFLFIKRDITARYRQTFIGMLWAIIQPLFLMFIFTLIFSRFLNISSSGAPYPVFSYVALLPWTFFSRVFNNSSSSLLGKRALITKVWFPREILPVSEVFSSFFDFIIASLVFLVMLLFYQIPFTWNLLYILLLLPLQIVFAIGMSLLLSIGTVIFRDLKFALPLLVQLWMYGTPIIYSLKGIQGMWRNIFYLNPLTGIIEGYREVIIFGHPPHIDYLLVSLAFTLVVCVGGYRLFKKFERLIPDII